MCASCNLHEADTIDNDDQNKDMLVAAGSWYATPSIGRYEDAIAALDRAADLELVPTDHTMLRRLTTYYQYGSDLQKQAEAETDPEAKAALMEQATRTFQRTVEIGNAMTNLFSANKGRFLLPERSTGAARRYGCLGGQLQDVSGAVWRVVETRPGRCSERAGDSKKIEEPVRHRASFVLYYSVSSLARGLIESNPGEKPKA